MSTRRNLLKGTAAAACSGNLITANGFSLQEGKSRIGIENQREGSRDWQLTRMKPTSPSAIRTHFIEGYCRSQSVRAGEALEICVSTNPVQNFQIEIFRTGYYQGCGARLMATYTQLAGKTQEVPEYGQKRLRECRWETSLEIKIPKEWISGVYVGRLTTESDSSGHGYWQSYIVFIVKDDRPADILVQCSDNTWQAYNQWPDHDSVYTHPKGNQGPWADVSFDRPYGKYSQIFDHPMTMGSGEWLCFEFPMSYWLEKEGYDVTYCSNSDMLSPHRGIKCKAFLSVGHDEYWDRRQYDSVVAMRDAGVNLMFLSGNSVCWVSPYRESFDGRQNRILFRGGPYGGSYTLAESRNLEHGPFPHRGPDEGYLIGARNVDPVNGGGDWVCTSPDHWIYEGTGMKLGQTIPGLIGWEYHGDPPKDLAGLEIIAEGTALQGGVNPQHWTATIYPGPNGNFVFNASTIWWAQAMSSPPGHMLPWSHWSRPHGPDSRVQRMTANLLQRALGGE
ncbi:MAG: N,N-dimethylformamidase beta subunit family domain-containing protein [Planctomycetota bacterium]|nr:N,N-dimethylformamidase beta subunit family domain-containing protein [Planctomycetota bacterium]